MKAYELERKKERKKELKINKQTGNRKKDSKEEK